MEISKELVLKGLGGLGAASAAALGIGLGGNPFSRSSESKDFENLEEINNSLNLPERCKLQKNAASTCGSLSSEELKNINFDGKIDGDVTAANVSLEISKDADKNFFPGGYKFTFKTSADVTNPISLKKDTNPEFKIKKKDDGTWSLEKAWTKGELAKRVGLNCGENDCAIGDNFNVYISEGKKLSNAIAANKNRKIKFEENQEGYNQGLKFTIKEGDINFSNSNASSAKKLEKYETYEIKEQAEGGEKKWYFSRKDSAAIEKNKKLNSLGFPTNCVFDDASDEKNCGTLSDTALKAIKFEGKTSTALKITKGSSSNATLKIRKDGDEDIFPDGIKIIFEVNADVIISGGLNANWELGTNPEYKIKKSNGSTIEKAWSLNELTKKVNLTCGSHECTLGSEINIFEDNNNYTIGAKIKNNSKKLNCLQGPGNQGFIFILYTGDISIDNAKANKKGNVEKIKNAGSESITYEIKEHEVDGTRYWFLSKGT